MDSVQTPLQFAQNYEEPPAVIPGVGGESQAQSYGQEQPEGAPQGQDAASLLVRVDRLEDQVRALNGQIQQLQFGQSRLESELKKFQGDVDFRFRESKARDGGPEPRLGKRSDAGSGPSPSLASSSSDFGAPQSHPHDAFNSGLDPDARGAPPRPLGTLPAGGEGGANVIAAPSAALGPQADPNAPLDLGSVGGSAAPQPSSQVGFASIAPRPNLSPPPTGASNSTDALMGGAPADPREDFDLALVSFNNGQFDAAEHGFRDFLHRHPKNRLAPEATFYLGESYWKRGRTRQAAEQYLKVSTAYAQSPRAPASLLKLGLSLEKLGSREQACASWEQISRKYPNAPAAIRASAGRDIKRDQC